jgi:hypothetical protein
VRPEVRLEILIAVVVALVVILISPGYAATGAIAALVLIAAGLGPPITRRLRARSRSGTRRAGRGRAGSTPAPIRRQSAGAPGAPPSARVLRRPAQRPRDPRPPWLEGLDEWQEGQPPRS